MKRSDWFLLALNVATLLFAMLGLAAQHRDPMSAALMLGTVTALINGAVLIRRSGRVREPARVREPERPAEIDLDARQLLDIDQRLEALERAEDRRLQALVESGQITGPAAPWEDPPSAPAGRQRV